jgi:hypothetical protein
MTETTARRIELALYAILLLIMVGFLAIAMADGSPAATPGRSCSNSAEALTEASKAVGEDLAAITTMGSAETGENWGVMRGGRILIGPAVACEHLTDVLRHEYAHVLQFRTYGYIYGQDWEVEADLLSRRWGSEFLPYITEREMPVTDNNINRAGHVAHEHGK